MLQSPRETPLVRSRIEALLRKIVENGCSPAEAAAALSKARELASEYGFASDEFQWPVEASEETDESELSPVEREPSRSSDGSRGRGIGRLAERLILEHPDWTYQRIADNVNRRIPGAQATAKSVRWYSNAMRKEGIDGTRRQQKTRPPSNS